MKRYKLINKTYMTLQLIVNDSTILLGPRGKDFSTVVLPELTQQIKHLQDKGLIIVREVK